ncbi:sensor histidine kinase [Gallaecimonas sp. GXIMD1310]|uniref:sensor histidine kinase n=1 Tax=Gallaecimonas sp. GXIMD1310 TaxID=3131926 RepID=UPI00324B979F
MKTLLQLVDRQLLETIGNVAPMGLALIDRDLRYCYINPVLATSNGTSPEAHLGQHIRDILPADAAEHVVRLLEQVLASGEPVVNESVDSKVAGQYRAWQASYYPYLDEHQQSRGIIAIVQDVTEKKTALQRMQDSEQRFRAVVASSPDGIVLVDRDARMQLVNPKMEQLFGYTAEELLGQNIEVLMPERYRTNHPWLFERFMENPLSREMTNRPDLPARRKDNSEFPIEIMLTPITSEGEQLILATIKDTTRAVADREAQQRALEEKTVLLGEVHHRVKNNLQVISSLLNLQARTAPEAIQEALTDSQHRVKAMALIHQLLYERQDFSQLDLKAYMERLGYLLRESMLRRMPGIKLNVNCEVDFSLDLDRAVPCGLLVNELVTNAIKHAFPDGQGQITIDILGPDRLVVSDDGIGLPDAVIPGEVDSLGYQLIPLLVEQMGATMAIARETGSRFDMQFNQEQG